MRDELDGQPIENETDQIENQNKLAFDSKLRAGDGRDLIEDFRTRSRADFSEGALAYKASVLAQAFKGRLPTASELKDVCEELGAELATALFLRTLMDSPHHGAFARDVRTFNFASWDPQVTRAAQVEVAIVASNLFQSGRQWGDHVDEWRLWARELGFTTEVIETDPRRSIASNARVIFEHLARSPSRRRIIVTYGQGSAEFRYLLHRRLHRDPNEPVPEEIEQIRGWISVCGAFSGASSSRYFQENRVRRLLARLRMKVAGRNPIVLAETSSLFPLWRRPLPDVSSLPLAIASIVAVPTRNQVPAAQQIIFSELAKAAPNDGVVSVTEACAHPGLILAVPGMNHRAANPILEPILKRTLAVVARSFGVGLEEPIKNPKTPSVQ